MTEKNYGCRTSCIYCPFGSPEEPQNVDLSYRYTITSYKHPSDESFVPGEIYTDEQVIYIKEVKIGRECWMENVTVYYSDPKREVARYKMGDIG